MKFSVALSLSLAMLVDFVAAVMVPGASTPLFYLVASGTTSTSCFFPYVRLRDSSGAWFISDSGAPAQFYFMGNRLVVNGRQSSVNTRQVGSGSCANSGQVVTTPGSNTNKCATFDTFGLESNRENSQLGAHLVFNNVGSFYVCGRQRDVYYKRNPSDEPSDCTTPLQLKTLAV
ncbi:hypothetical protein NMY22_g5169 [Coprinellus aureogranulatus]|nr:hypothetical protein NMY22_g5169 [Coprinellus aureogranulatus]